MSAYVFPRHPAFDANFDCLSSMIPRLMGSEKLSIFREKLHLFPPQKLPVSYILLRSAAHYLPVYGIKSWCPMLASRLPTVLASFGDSGYKDIYVHYIHLEIWTQNLELRWMEPATKFCNWVRRSSWESRYSHWIWFFLMNLIGFDTLTCFCLATFLSSGDSGVTPKSPLDWVRQGRGASNYIYKVLYLPLLKIINC